MSETIEIYCNDIPVAQPRQRVAVRSFGGNSVATNYTPKDSPVNTFKASLRFAAQQVFRGAPINGPVRVDVEAVFPRPKGMIWKKRPMPRIRHAKKPDRDNLDKAVLDALNGLIYLDDCQVCAGEVQKWIASGDESPHVVVRISRLEE